MPASRLEAAKQLLAAAGGRGGGGLGSLEGNTNWKVTRSKGGGSLWWWVYVPGSDDWPAADEPRGNRVVFKYKKIKDKDWGKFGSKTAKAAGGWWHSSDWGKNNPSYEVSCWVDGELFVESMREPEKWEPGSPDPPVTPVTPLCGASARISSNGSAFPVSPGCP
eukprot:SAG22_NODE_689_length_7904_cov_3.365279_7_plen_164_part_00